MAQTVEKVQEILEKKYPNHTFEWQEKAGRLWALCPNPNHHDTHPTNFNVYQGEDGKWHWKCFACGISGPKPADISPLESDIAIFREHLQEKLMHGFDNTFLDYMQKRIPKIGEEIGFDSLFSLEIGAYSKEITEKLSKNEDKNEDKDINVREKIEKWGMAQYEWLVFVYRDVNGKPVFVKFRNISIPKYDPKWHDVGTKTIRLTKNTAEIGFFGDGLRSQAPALFLLEGEFDAITTTLVLGWEYSALAMSGTSGFKKEAIEQIVRKVNVKDKPRKAIFVQPDWDQAGQVAIEKLVNSADIEFLRKNDIRTIPNSPEEGIKDMDEFLKGKYDDADSIMSDMLKKENTISLAKIKEEIEKKKREELEKIYDNLPSVIREMAGVEDKKNSSEIVIVKTFENDDIPKPPEIRCGVFPVGYMSMLAAPSSTGKTYAAIHYALQYIKETQENVCLWLSEDVEQTKYRVYQMLENTNWKQEKDILKDKIYHIEDLPDALIVSDNRKYELNDDFFNALKYVVEKFNFIVLDPLLNFFASNENDNVAARLFMNALSKLVFKTNKIILLIHHTNKNNANISDENDVEKIKEAFKERVRGASAFVDAARSVLYLLPHREPIDRKKAVKAIVIKSNVVATGKTDFIQLPFAYIDNKFDNFKNEFTLVR